MAGYQTRIQFSGALGIFLPAKLQTPAVREKLAGLGADPMALTSAEFDALVKREIETNTELVKAAGIKVN